MLKLLERSVSDLDRRLVLLAPPHASVPDLFTNVDEDVRFHCALVREMQRLRGSIYVDEHNVTRDQLTPDGRHRTPEDDKSWHLIMTDDRGRLTSCALFLPHENASSLQDLRIRNSPLATTDAWSDSLKGAVKSEIDRARQAGLRLVELGGWAIQKERRCTSEGLLMVLSIYSLSRMLGGAIGITTANVAHSCSSILRRLGGSSLEFEGTKIPPYFDPRYNTEIELLRFDSRRPGTRYVGLLDMIQEKLANVVVFASSLDTAGREPYHNVGVLPAAIAAA